MRGRSAAMTLAIACLVVLFGVVLLAPLPYVLLSPGPTLNTLGEVSGRPIIKIEGHPTYPTTGHLNLTTVSETDPGFHVRLPQVLHAWWSSTRIVVPRDVIYPPGQSAQEVQHQNAQQMLDSQQTAVVAGLQQAGIDALNVLVVKVLAGAPADGVLRKGDQITSVDGHAVGSSAAVTVAISQLKPGTQVHIGIVRQGVAKTVSLETRAAPTDPSQAQVGIELSDDYDPPFKVDIHLGQQIGGPSAGMMFALAIYDLLTPGALTGGRFIAGTGEISVDGDVGVIGGVQQKIAGAYAAGARYFFVPAGNCSEAAHSPLVGKIELMKVTTLSQAISDLRALNSGNESAITRCGS